MTSNSPSVPTALILTALPVEMTAVLAHLGADRSMRMMGQVLCEIGSFTTSDDRSWRVVACELGPGNVDTAGAVVAVTSRLLPDVLMFVGLAGALKDYLKIGDVVAGSEVAWTERGKWSESGYLPRIRTVSLSAPLVQFARKIARDGNWTDRLAVARPGARAVVGQIASGEKVIADEEYRTWLRTAFSDALAIENEGFALARAAEAHADVQRYVVRGISDRADGGKTDSDHDGAAQAAAAFAFELLDTYLRARDAEPEHVASGGGQSARTISQNRDPGDAGPAARSADRAGHAFISYASADSPLVDGLQERLKAAGVHVWRDTSDLSPGQDRRTAIRRAITSDAFVFLACFSLQGLTQATTRQNEELTLAIDQMRVRRPDQPWLIPVRFDDCAIPDLDVGGGRTLASIQRADLFGQRYEQNLAGLIAAIQRIIDLQLSAKSRLE